MVKALRLMKIKDIMRANGTVDINTLSELTGVSKVTIRNDLIQLEQEGFLCRTYGGAILFQKSPSVTETAVPEDKNLGRLSKLRELGDIVAKYVVPHSWIMLGYGTTCKEISKNLVDKTINVVTGNIDAAVTLSEAKSVDIFIPGGYLKKHYDYLMLNGEWYQKALMGLTIDQAYISVAGVDPAGFSVGDVLECQTLELIRNIAKELIVVIDSNKFDKTAFFRLSSLEYADTIITNDDIPASYRELCKQKNIKLLTPMSFK